MTKAQAFSTCFAMILAATCSMAEARGGHVGRSSGSKASPGGSHAIRGHIKKNGAYVAPTRAKNPNGTKRDNYSSKGNINPATGKEGTRDPDKP